MSIPATLLQRLNWQRFFRGEGAQTAPVKLHRRRVYILPTRAGLVFAILLLVMLLGSVNYNKSLGYLLTFLLASLAVIGILHTYRNLLNLQLALGRVVPVFSGSTANIPVVLLNPQPFQRLALQLRFPEGDPIACDLSGQGRKIVTLPKQVTRRGWTPVGRFIIETYFPLGLFRAWSHVEIKQSFLVYPRPARQAALPAQTVYKASLNGDQGHGTDDFAALRSYHPGDSLRHIHWKAAARSQVLLTKQFGGDRREELWLDWQTLAPHPAETRLSMLTRGVLEAERLGFAYGLHLPDMMLDPSCGNIHQLACLKALALYGLRDEASS